MNDQIDFWGCPFWRGKMATKGRGYHFAGLINIDQLDLGARQPRRERGDEATDETGADHRDMVTWTRRRVPHPVYRRLHVGGEGRPPVRDRVGNIDDGLSRDDEPVLVR